MDYLLLFLILGIVIAIGYVLSKPFSKQTDIHEEMGFVDHTSVDDIDDDQYQTLLREIKALERDCESGLISKEACKDEIIEKKKVAAHLLRICTPSKHIGEKSQTFIATKDINVQPTAELTTKAAHFCPQCGDKVLINDKFCMHCGHRLQP